jgi:hypothetical protein
MPIKDAAGWIAETLLYRFLFPKNNFFFSFPFFSFVVRSKHCKRYKTFISLCVCHSVWVVCVCIRWLPIVPLNAIPQSTLTVYRSVDSAHTHTHTHTLFSLVQFHESGEGKKKRWRGRDREKKDISHYKILSYMYIIGENTPLYKLVHRNPLPHPPTAPAALLYSHRCVPLCNTPCTHTHTHHTLSVGLAEAFNGDFNTFLQTNWSIGHYREQQHTHERGGEV